MILVTHLECVTEHSGCFYSDGQQFVKVGKLQVYELVIKILETCPYARVNNLIGYKTGIISCKLQPFSCSAYSVHLIPPPPPPPPPPVILALTQTSCAQCGIINNNKQNVYNKHSDYGAWRGVYRWE